MSKQSLLTEDESETAGRIAKKKKRQDKHRKQESEKDLKTKKDQSFHTKQKDQFGNPSSKSEASSTKPQAPFSSSIQKTATKQLINQGFNVMAQEEDTQELQKFQASVKEGERVFKGAKKANKFLTKNQKFSQSVTTGKLDDMRFSSVKAPKATKPLADAAGKAATKTARNKQQSHRFL